MNRVKHLGPYCLLMKQKWWMKSFSGKGNKDYYRNNCTNQGKKNP